MFLLQNITTYVQTNKANIIINVKK